MKEIYIVIIKCADNFVHHSAAHSIHAFEKYDDAVAYIDSLVDSQNEIEGEKNLLVEDIKDTSIVGWPFNKVLYGTRVTNHWKEKEYYTTDRFIIKKELK